MTLLDAFEERGPNGTHACLAFEPMGPSAASMARLLLMNQPLRYGRRIRYPSWMARSILRQALLGLDYLHQQGIVHGDFQPGNLLFGLREAELNAVDANTMILESLARPRAVSAAPRRLDGKINDPWAPKCLANVQPLVEYTKLGRDVTVKISDLGGGMLAFFPCIASLPFSLCVLRGYMSKGSPGLIDFFGGTLTGDSLYSFLCREPRRQASHSS
jgi:non-specific serine/threonine protein kinase